MNHPAPPPPQTLSISAVERDTGIPKDTLRIWEKRYGFPQPLRDEHAQRCYPDDQVARLKLITRLLNRGWRPGRVVPLPAEQLHALLGQAPQDAPPGPLPQDPDLMACLDQVRQHDLSGLRRLLNQMALQMGLARFIGERVAPLNALIGEAWIRGDIQVFEEHLYTECVTTVLRAAIATIPESQAQRPRVLLTTIPQEPHGLGLLMAQSLMALHGCHCISLGVQTPLADMVQAALAHAVDAVALSFSASLPVRQVQRSLRELRRQMPTTIQIWAGGGNPALRVADLPGVQCITALNDIPGHIAHWRERNTPPSPG